MAASGGGGASRIPLNFHQRTKDVAKGIKPVSVICVVRGRKIQLSGKFRLS
jgi:hypothetical protein